VFFIKEPRRRSSKSFTSPFRSKLLRTREYYYSLFVTLVVKIILFFFLWMLFATSVRIMRKSFRNISDAWRVILPAAVAGIACLIGYHIFKNVMDIRRYSKEMDEQRRSGGHP
jgi:hypothetical protein